MDSLKFRFFRLFYLTEKNHLKNLIILFSKLIIFVRKRSIIKKTDISNFDLNTRITPVFF